jgi:hypothetical protein
MGPTNRATEQVHGGPNDPEHPATEPGTEMGPDPRNAKDPTTQAADPPDKVTEGAWNDERPGPVWRGPFVWWCGYCWGCCCWSSNVW